MSEPTSPVHQPIDSALHYQLLHSTIERGFPFSIAELTLALEASEERVRDSMRRLEANHGLVTHPTSLEPWLVHPFSSTPTLFTVANRERRWWAPCIWCALGIAALVPNPVRITTLLGGEGERCAIEVDGAELAPTGLLAHFPIPVAQAWDNVQRHCACTLVFDDVSSIDDWCANHGIGRGEVLPLERVAELARVWYAGHLAPDWRKASPAEARVLFESVGLTSAHWRVSGGEGRF